jgi:hypothetical protein
VSPEGKLLIADSGDRSSLDAALTSLSDVIAETSVYAPLNSSAQCPHTGYTVPYGPTGYDTSLGTYTDPSPGPGPGGRSPGCPSETASWHGLHSMQLERSPRAALGWILLSPFSRSRLAPTGRVCLRRTQKRPSMRTCSRTCSIRGHVSSKAPTDGTLPLRYGLKPYGSVSQVNSATYMSADMAVRHKPGAEHGIHHSTNSAAIASR